MGVAAAIAGDVPHPASVRPDLADFEPQPAIQPIASVEAELPPLVRRRPRARVSQATASAVPPGTRSVVSTGAASVVPPTTPSMVPAATAWGVTFESIPLEYVAEVAVADAPPPAPFDAFGVGDRWKAWIGARASVLARAVDVLDGVDRRLVAVALVAIVCGAGALGSFTYLWSNRPDPTAITPIVRAWSMAPPKASVAPARPILVPVTLGREELRLTPLPLASEARASASPAPHATRPGRSLISAVRVERREVPAAQAPEQVPIESEPVDQPASAELAGAIAGTPADRAAVEHAIAAYEQAHDRLDQEAISALSPSLDAPGLSAALDGVSARDVTFRECGVSWGVARAVATCAGEVRYLRVEGTEIRVAVWTLHLSRRDARWRIDHVMMR